MEENNQAQQTVETTTETPEIETVVEQSDSEAKVADLMKELAQLKATSDKQKKALDNALKVNGDLTKELRARKTQQELDDEAKAEEIARRDEYVKELENYKRANEARERYLVQGMNAELAKRAADAEVSGDMDALADIQKQHTSALLKAQESEWKKSRPQLFAGEGQATMTKEQIFAIKDATERQRAIAENISLFS